jgi:hypothetical protein
MGKAYNEVDCYELVVEGMEKMGVKYRGAGGLAEQLVAKAVDSGLPENTFLSGEGLIEAAGTQIYAKRAGNNQGIATQTEQIINEMKPLLKRGAILSFSTPTRGHTGVISRKNEYWTFINSGKMDHTVGSHHPAKGVGEEILEDEIKNWLLRAARRNESLEITLGELDEKKLAAFLKPASRLSTLV